MSIRDYNKKYVIIDGVTNEKIVVPKTNCVDYIYAELEIDDYLLLNSIKKVLGNSDSLSLMRTYMKDN